MNLHLPWQRATRTGIDLGSRWVKAVELHADGSVARGARVPRAAGPVEEPEIARLCDVLRRQGFSLGSVSLLATHDALRRQVIRLPDKPDAARDDAIVRNHFVDEEGESGPAGPVGWWELPRSQRKTDGREALAYTADDGVTGAWLRGFESQGVWVRAIDTHSSAFARTLRDVNCVVADLGWSRLGLTLAVGGLPVYERADAASGVDGLVRGEAERSGRTCEQVELLMQNERSERALLGLPGAMGWARAVCESIAATADYAVRRYGLAEAPRVVLAGGGATGEVVQTLTSLLGAGYEVEQAGVAADRFAAQAAAGRWAA